MLALALVSVAGARRAGGDAGVADHADDVGRREARVLDRRSPGGIPITPRPGVILFHGLGGKHQDMEPIAEQFFAPAGYETLECDARGHGTSEGLFGLDGPRDVQDTQELFNWFAGQLGDTNIGALGISLGGGAVWNAPTAGVPFKAIVPMITWTNLLTSLAPQGLSKSGLVQYLAGLVPTSRWDPQLLAASAGPRRRAPI